jgi:hypothetical protein
MRQRLELRDMRTLERRGLFQIFEALDPAERLPGELIAEGRRHRWLEWRKLPVFLSAAYLPLLALVVVVLASLGLGPAVSFGAAGVLLVACFVLAWKVPAR